MIVDSNALACRINAYLGANPKPELSRHVFYVSVNAFAQLSKSRPLLLDVEFWNPSTALPSKMRDAIMLFEQELARHNGHMMASGSSGFVGMME